MSAEPRGEIRFVRRDAMQGAFWLRRAYAMFRAAPFPWLLLLVTYYALVALAELGPWPAFGKLAASVLKPVFAVGFLAAAWSQERGGTPRLSDLFRGFRSNLWALIPLGLVFIFGMSLAFTATSVVDGGMLIALLSGAQPPSDELLDSGRVELALLFGMLCALPTLLALWFAPALVVFNDAGALTALLTSLRAALANWRAVGVFGLLVFVYGGVLPALVITVARLFGVGVAAIIGVGLVLPYLVAFLATFQIADYVAYRDVFHPDEPTADGSASPQAG
jgi:hypothetical protein